MTKEALVEAHPRDDLLRVLIRHAEAGEDWPQRILDEMLTEGLRLSEGHRRVLRRMADRDARAAQASFFPTPPQEPVQTPPRRAPKGGLLQGPGSYRPKGADR